MANKDSKKPAVKKKAVAKPRSKVKKQEIMAGEIPEELLQKAPPELKAILESPDIPEDTKKRLVSVSVRHQQTVIHGNRLTSSLPSVEIIDKLHELYPVSTEKIVDDYIAGNKHERSSERLGFHYTFLDRNLIPIITIIAFTSILLIRTDIDNITLKFVIGGLGGLGFGWVLLLNAKSIYNFFFKNKK